MNQHITEINIIRILADGQFHAGSIIADRLNMTRSAVHQSVLKLELWGLVVFSVKGKGYRLSEKINLFDILRLNHEKIPFFENLEERTIQIYQSRFSDEDSHKQQIQEEIGPSIFLRSIIDSTNQYLLDHMENLTVGDVCIAEYQYSARGRRGRKYYAPFGSNLYFSLFWQLPLNDYLIAPLSLVIGVITVNTLTELGVADLKLKWPNDIYLKNKKLGGILVESKIRDKKANIVIGIGLNLNMYVIDPQIVTQSWISLIQMEYKIDKTELTIALRKNIFAGLIKFQKKGFAPFYTEWQEYDIFEIGDELNLVDNMKVTTGTYIGIDNSGAIKLKIEATKSNTLTDTIIKKHIGDVSLRKAE